MSRRWTRRGRCSDPKRRPSSMASRWRPVLVPPCTAKSGRLVDDDHIVVAMQHPALQFLDGPRGSICTLAAPDAAVSRCLVGKRRHPDHLARPRYAGWTWPACRPGAPGRYAAGAPIGRGDSAGIAALEPAIESKTGLRPLRPMIEETAAIKAAGRIICVPTKEPGHAQEDGGRGIAAGRHDMSPALDHHRHVERKQGEGGKPAQDPGGQEGPDFRPRRPGDAKQGHQRTHDDGTDDVHRQGAERIFAARQNG